MLNAQINVTEDKVRRIKILAVLCLFFVVLSLVIDIWPVLFLVFFSVVNMFLLTYDRYIDMPIDIELSTFSVILMTLRFGLGWGIVTAFMTKVAAIYYNKDFNMNSLFTIAGYVLAAFIASFLGGFNVVFLGMVATIALNVYNYFVGKFLTYMSGSQILMYGSSNFLFNSFMFFGFADYFMKIMAFL